ncbi:MAG: hypothetical protein M9921_12420 [Fimbriimonadaceae bacterium]|nr:hypothetical protein [Chthonomonadaceae bacterium]MCO5297652.1 hypothetical protein [Fimbriimonadaceae bacterium]
MKWVLAIAAAASMTAASGQQLPRRTPVPVRLQILHADPWFVKGMLEGQQLVSPELSSIFGFMGFPEGTGNAINSLFSGGKLIVNPTDNSLWFFPDWDRRS